MTDEIRIDVKPTPAEALALKVAEYTFEQMAKTTALEQGLVKGFISMAGKPTAADEKLLNAAVAVFKKAFLRERAAFVALLLEVYSEEELALTVELQQNPVYETLMSKMPALMSAMQDIMFRVMSSLPKDL